VSFELWPAIDIRAGKCVRLLKGEFSAETIYGDPLDQAEAFVAAGAKRLHVVDLDAARDGGSPNRELVVRIATSLGVPIEVGGGVRDERAAEALLDAGVARVVVGTIAVERPGLLAAMAERWPGQVLAGVDHRAARGADGQSRREVAVRGWLDSAGVGLVELLRNLDAMALGGVIVTDIDRDGTAKGPDVEGLGQTLGLTSLPVLASGGVAAVSDLVALGALRSAGRCLCGVVVGRALLSGRVSIREAIRACEP
jgi:phosphoribosylformimino-5-aminoimidazole carboxamide ribotide isomerase